MEFAVLVERMIQNQPLKNEINTLVQRKLAGAELDQGPRNPVISAFIESELARLETATVPLPPKRPDSERLNQFFRERIERAWNGD